MALYKRIIQLSLFLIFYTGSFVAFAGGRCTGSASCRACTNCSRCAHCSSGGSCGVCSGTSSGRSSTTTKHKKTRAKSSSISYYDPEDIATPSKDASSSTASSKNKARHLKHKTTEDSPDTFVQPLGFSSQTSDSSPEPVASSYVERESDEEEPGFPEIIVTLFIGYLIYRYYKKKAKETK